MITIGVILTSLIGISATVALMLGAAWYDLDRPLHARTWSFAFALTTLVWGMGLAVEVGWLDASVATAWMPTLGGLCTTLMTMGFRQRAGLPDRRWPLFGSAAGHAAIVLALVRATGSHLAWIGPLAAYNAVLFALAANTLRGRRQGERSAERVAEGGLVLLALLHFLVLGGVIGRAAGLMTVDLARLGTVTLLLMPAVVGGIGLFTIILLTGDLADRTRRLAATDMLTGLLNRRGFDESARRLFAATRRDGRSMALVMIDVDRFKDINDRFGHPAGDRVLRAVCARIGQGIDRHDVFARIGGEEFALILTDVDLQAAACAVEVLRLRLESMAVDLPEPYRVTASFGIAAPERAGESLAALFRRADQALYRSKQDGRNRVTLAEPG